MDGIVIHVEDISAVNILVRVKAFAIRMKYIPREFELITRTVSSVYEHFNTNDILFVFSILHSVFFTQYIFVL